MHVTFPISFHHVPIIFQCFHSSFLSLSIIFPCFPICLHQFPIIFSQSFYHFHHFPIIFPFSSHFPSIFSQHFPVSHGENRLTGASDTSSSASTPRSSCSASARRFFTWEKGENQQREPWVNYWIVMNKGYPYYWYTV